MIDLIQQPYDIKEKTSATNLIPDIVYNPIPYEIYIMNPAAAIKN